jgi:hypothetical protein
MSFTWGERLLANPATNRLLDCMEAACAGRFASTFRVLGFARTGRLRIAGQGKDGRLLFRESDVLAAAASMSKEERCRNSRDGGIQDLPEGLLPCGCCKAPPDRYWPVAPGESEPIFLCREAQGLDMARRLCGAFAAAAPSDVFLRNLAAVTLDAFERHIGLRSGGHEEVSPSEACLGQSASLKRRAIAHSPTAFEKA